MEVKIANKQETRSEESTHFARNIKKSNISGYLVLLKNMKAVRTAIKHIMIVDGKKFNSLFL